MGLTPTLIPLNFESDLDHYLDTTQIQIFIFIFIRYLGRGMHSPSALVQFVFHFPQNTFQHQSTENWYVSMCIRYQTQCQGIHKPCQSVEKKLDFIIQIGLINPNPDRLLGGQDKQ